VADCENAEKERALDVWRNYCKHFELNAANRKCKWNRKWGGDWVCVRWGMEKPSSGMGENEGVTVGCKDLARWRWGVDGEKEAYMTAVKDYG